MSQGDDKVFSRNPVGSLGASALLQVSAILLISMVAGTTFGIWQGYDPTAYSPATFLEVHQAAVRGLNVLLPALAMGSILLTIALAFLARNRRLAFRIYLVAIVLMVAGGLVTRLVNQPVNVQVMGWTLETLPQNWDEIRGIWWHWHVWRTFAAIAATIVLILAVFVDRHLSAPGIAMDR